MILILKRSHCCYAYCLVYMLRNNDVLGITLHHATTNNCNKEEDIVQYRVLRQNKISFALRRRSAVLYGRHITAMLAINTIFKNFNIS